MNEIRLAKVNALVKAKEASDKAVQEAREQARQGYIKYIRELVPQLKTIDDLVSAYARLTSDLPASQSIWAHQIDVTKEDGYFNTFACYARNHGAKITGLATVCSNTYHILNALDGKMYRCYAKSAGGWTESVTEMDIERMSHDDLMMFANGAKKFIDYLYSKVDAL